MLATLRASGSEGGSRKPSAGQNVGGLRKLQASGLPKVDFQFTLTFAAYNLVRLRTLGVEIHLQCVHSYPSQSGRFIF